jgi:hypothetical protein
LRDRERVQIACLLNDCSIKVLSYWILTKIFSIAAAVAFLIGLGLAIAIGSGSDIFGLEIERSVYSVFAVLGASFVFYRIHRQYRKKLASLLCALGEAAATGCSVDARVVQVTDELRHVDDGMQR